MPEVPALSGVVEEVFGPGGPLARAMPGFEARAGQVAMAVKVARAFEAGGVLLAEAGTGTGKTLLALSTQLRPTALFAANDEMAIGLIKTVNAGGLRVPRDLSVVGFDGIPYADYCEPTLTTIVQPRRELGASAAAELIALMTMETSAVRKDIELPATLVLRDSTCPPSARNKR